MNNRIGTRQAGFTLIELVITVSILLVLVSFAVPYYRDHVLRSNRTDAMAALTRIAAAQEKFYLQNNTYTVSLAADGLDLDFPDDLATRYLVAMLAADTNTFLAVATAVDEQAEDSACRVFTVNAQGTRGATDSTGTDTTATCWR